MITQSKDEKTGIYRFEVNTVNVDACRKEIEDSGCVKIKDGVADTINYLVDYGNVEIQITTTPTRAVLFSTNRFAALSFLDLIKGEERRGTAWSYDDSVRTDYYKEGK